MEEHPTPSPTPASEAVLVPRKKRMTKGQPRMQTSIDVLAEVLAERCRDVCESEYEPEDDGEDDEGGSDENERGANRAHDGDRDKEPEDSAANAKKRSNEPYKFTKCKLKNRHFLREGQGLAMIRSLGLEQFLLHTEVPKFNKSYCTEFISTYNHHKGSGVVNGRVIKITPQSVRKVTGLPLGHRGERAMVHDVRAEDLSIMDRLIPGLKRTSYGYDLRYLRYKDQTETFVAVASALSEKLVCRTFKLTYIKGAIILAMENSLRLKILMQWADFMAETIKNALKLTQLRTRNVRFAFGEWLTGMIENALVEDVGSGPGEPEREFKEEPLEALPMVEANTTELTPEPAAAPESLPLVVHTALQPQKFKKRARTADVPEEVHRLQQELADAERREQWFVEMNVSMSREIQRLKQELESVRGSSSAGTPKQESEMQLVVKDNNSSRQTETAAGTEQQLLEKLIEHLQSRSIRHEAEVLRLKQAVDEQSNYIELIKQSRTTVAGACGKEPFDEASLVREQKRLRREWEKEKLKSAL